MVVAGVPTGALVVFALIGVALVLFVSEVIPLGLAMAATGGAN